MFPQSSPEEWEDGLARREQREREALWGVGGILTFHAPAVGEQLAAIAAEQGKTKDELVAEALNFLFLKYGKPLIGT